MSASTRTGETSIKRAALINMASRYGAAVVHLVYSIVLARILAPADFGIVAIAQVFVTFFALFQDMGLGSAIIQRQDLESDDLSRLFGFSLVLGVCLAALFALFGLPISAVYGEPQLMSICWALSATVLFSTLNTVPNALLMKSRRFIVVGMRQVLCALAASVAGVASAALGAGPYAIVIYSISNALLAFLWNYATNRVVPQFRAMLVSVRKVFSYSAWLFGFNLINYFSRNADNLLIGYFFGTADLGNYGKAYQLMQMPQTYLTSMVAGVVHPMLAEQQDDLDRIYYVFVRMTKVLSLIGVLVSILCLFAADEIVDLLYGPQWTSSAVYLRCLAVSIWSQMVCGASGPMFQVLNRTMEQFVRGALIACAVVGGILTGVALGSVEAVAAFVGASYWVAFLLLLPFLIRRSFGRSIIAFLRMLVPDALIAVGVSLVLFLLHPLPLQGTLSLVVKTLAAGITWLALIVALGQSKWLEALLPTRLRRKLHRPSERNSHDKA